MTLLIVALAFFGAGESAAVKEKADKPAAEKRICRREAPATGSVMPGKRICHTKAEWDAISEERRRAAERIMDESGRSGGGM